MENLISSADSNIEDGENLVIDYEEKFDGDFFKSMKSLESGNQVYDLSKMPIEVSGLGIDLIYKA